MTLIKLPTLPTFKAMKSNLPNINNTVAHYTIRILLVAHILATSYWPTEYINIFQHLATRVVLAVLVVALLFWDIASGALLAILLVLSVQEAKSRQTGASILITSTQPALGNQVRKIALSTQEPELIPQSVYGQPQVPQMTACNERVGAYMDQIGELGISKQIQAGQGVQLVDGVPSIKVNMDQISTPQQPSLSLIQVSKEGYQMAGSENTIPAADLGTGSAPNGLTVNLGTEYDHPANKTLSENLKAQATGFITDKNLLDAQINSITGLDGSQPPCFVASQSGIWNAQGFGSITRAVDNEDCPHSFV
jgi:hypothetical protein